MKRYEPDKYYCSSAGEDVTPAMRESATGGFYSRADLIAAGCLVPVPDGEAMGAEYLPVGLRVSIPNHTGVYRRVGSGASAIPEPHSFVIMEDCNSGKEINVPYGTQAQPVRLVRLEDVG